MTLPLVSPGELTPPMRRTPWVAGRTGLMPQISVAATKHLGLRQTVIIRAVRRQGGLVALDHDVEWEAGSVPWARRSTSAGQAVRCYFCGGETAIGSYGDLPDDTGRLELYCDNELCDAREVVILVRRDGDDAYVRADVRALRAIDEGPNPPANALDRYHTAKGKVPRRQDTAPFTLDVR